MMNIRSWSIFLCLAGATAALAADENAGGLSAGIYRLPFADDTVVKVFDDFSTHRPNPALDLFAVDGSSPGRRQPGTSFSKQKQPIATAKT